MTDSEAEETNSRLNRIENQLSRLTWLVMVWIVVMSGAFILDGGLLLAFKAMGGN